MADSGGGRLSVEGLEGNASLLSGGGDIKVHLHERFGHVFIDSSGGQVEVWINPAAALKLQVAAEGGVALDPSLRLRAGTVVLFGWLAWLVSSAASCGDVPVVALQVDVEPLTNAIDAPEQTVAPAEPSAFSWTKAWYPAAVVENLDPDKPNKFTLLGRDYVLWSDAQGSWHCFTDRCPHRLATLSDGLVDKQSGELICAYHGWRFEGSGRCASIPQALDAASAATACNSKRSCATSFPTAVQGGLLWVWPDEAPTATEEAEATTIPLLPELADESLVPLKGRFMVRDLPYSYDFFVENVLDPTHVDFAHHGVAGFDANKFATLDLKQVEDNGSSGFVFQSLPQNPAKRGSFTHFQPPALICIRPGPDPAVIKEGAEAGAADARPGSDNPNVLSGLCFYVYPTKPGWCRLAGTSWVSDRQGRKIQSLSLFTSTMPVWLKHVLSFEFFAGDDVFLGAASKAYVAEGENWRRSYYMPTRADAAIVAFRKWLDKYSGGAVPFPPHMQLLIAALLKQWP
eukprot:gene4455-4711_t